MRRHNGTNKRLESKLSKSRALQSLQCVLPPTRSTYVLACRGAFPRLSAVPPGPHRRRKTPRYGTHCKFARSDSATLLAFHLAAMPSQWCRGADITVQVVYHGYGMHVCLINQGVTAFMPMDRDRICQWTGIGCDANGHYVTQRGSNVTQMVSYWAIIHVDIGHAHGQEPICSRIARITPYAIALGDR